MSLRKQFSLLFRASPLFRTVLWIIAIVLFVTVTRIASYRAKKMPVLVSINPQIGAPGDIMVITGNNFGNSRGSSFVEIGGSKLTSSCYLDWNDSEIKVIIPSNVQDGLVFVSTNEKSNQLFFANENDIPSPVRPDPKKSIPIISALSKNAASVGEVISIEGSNYGNSRGESAVFFTANHETNDVTQDNFISASDLDFDYELWSDTEIKVRIPDGAKTGSCYVKTDKGESNRISLSVPQNIGQKKYSNKHTFVVQLTQDIANAVSTDENSTITLRVPRPALFSSQPKIELSECNPTPILENFKNTIVHQIQLSSAEHSRVKFSHNFIITVYSVSTEINARKVKPFSETERKLFKTYTVADKCIPSTDSEIVSIAKNVVGKENNPYAKAKLLYNYLVENYKILQNPRTENAEIKKMLESKTGDAYDFAILYTALLRASGVPAIPMSGILVDTNSKSKNHWWTEFYIEGLGWIPVDAALGAGLHFLPFVAQSDAKAFYFGNLDSQHIAFSRGWNEIKSVTVNSSTVYKPRFYALQSIWEESTSSAVSYSSLWNNPSVLGIY